MTTPHIGTHGAQRGAVLIMALMFLTLLTLLGVTAMTNSTSEEKMVRATRDYGTAFQAAEAALRDAEADLVGNGSRAVPVDDPTFLGSLSVGACTSGVCLPAASGGTPIWQVSANWGTAATYAQYTFAQTFPTTGPGAVGQQPQYMIEYVGPVGSQKAFRITARGWGPNSVQLVTLQEEVIK